MAQVHVPGCKQFHAQMPSLIFGSFGNKSDTGRDGSSDSSSSASFMMNQVTMVERADSSQTRLKQTVCGGNVKVSSQHAPWTASRGTMAIPTTFAGLTLVHPSCRLLPRLLEASEYGSRHNFSASIASPKPQSTAPWSSFCFVASMPQSTATGTVSCFVASPRPRIDMRGSNTSAEQ